MTGKNVYEVDATTIDSNGVVVPQDLDGEPDAYEFGDRELARQWAAKIVNDADESVDAQPLATTSDDGSFQEYDEVGSTRTVATGSPPDNVELLSHDDVAASVGVKLVAATTPTTGTVKVVFNSRRYG